MTRFDSLHASEHEEQVALFSWALTEANLGNLPDLDLMFAVPNGAKLPFFKRGKRRISKQGARLKAEGLRPGVPDICLPVARGGYFGLFIELKVGRNKATPKQSEWIKKLNKAGYFATVCVGQDEARELLKEYCSLEPTRGKEIVEDEDG